MPGYVKAENYVCKYMFYEQLLGGGRMRLDNKLVQHPFKLFNIISFISQITYPCTNWFKTAKELRWGIFAIFLRFSHNVHLDLVAKDLWLWNLYQGIIYMITF